MKTARPGGRPSSTNVDQTPHEGRSIPGEVSNKRLLHVAFGLHRFGRAEIQQGQEANLVSSTCYRRPSTFVLSYSMLDFACASRLDSVQGLLLLLDAVHLSRDGRGLVRGGGGGRWGRRELGSAIESGGNLVSEGGGGRGLVSAIVGSRDLMREAVGLVAGSSGEVGVSDDRSGLDRRADVVDRSNGEVRAAVGGGGLLVGVDGRARLLGRSGGCVLGRRRGVVLLNGSARKLLGGVLADVALVDGGLLGTTNVFLSEAHVLRGRLAGSLHGLVGVLGGDFAELLGLLVGDLGGVVEVRVNELLVGDVDQRSEVDNAGGDEKQAPLGSDLDEEVADDGSEGGLQIVSMLEIFSWRMFDLQQWWPRHSRRRECAGTQ